MAKTQKPRYFLWVIMGLLVVGLLGFGTGGLSGNIRNVGTVGDMQISVSQYQRELNQQIRAFEAQIGTPVGFQQAQQLGIDQSVLRQIITQRTLDNEAGALGVSVGDARVRDEVLRVPSFRGIDGTFDRDAYRFALQQSGMTEAEFETGIRQEIARTLLQGAVVGGTPLPDAYADALSQFVGEARAITWATVTADALAAPVPTPSPTELTAYYAENPGDFTRPETRDMSYAWLTPSMIQDDVAVDETVLRALYQDRIAEFVRPERRLVERLVFADTAAADVALASLTNAARSFDDLVADRGLDLADVDMGDVAQANLGAAGDAVFTANSGDVVGPFETDLGPALFRMNAVLAAEEVTFEDASPDLREELSSARAIRIIQDSIDKINDLLAGGAAIEDLATQTDMALGNIAWAQDDQTGIAAYESFRTAAAALTVGDFAQLTDMEDGGVFALRLNAITPPQLRPLEEVRDAVIADWRAQTTKTALIAQATQTATEILPLTGFASVGLTSVVETGLTRRSFIAGTPPGFLTDVFAMAVGDVRVIDNGTNAIVVRLDGITAPDAQDAQTVADKLAAAESAAAGISQDIFEAFAATVQARTEVVVNQSAINAVNAQMQ